MTRMRRALGRVLAATGLLWLLVTFTPVTRWWARALAGDWTDADGDVLIVLGSDASSDGVVGGGTYWRAAYALRAWRTGHFRSVLVSGGDGVAAALREFLACQGVPPQHITVEGRSLSTRENAAAVAALLRGTPGRKVLLTSDAHMFRAHRAFLRAGLDVVPRPIPDLLKRYSDWQHRGDVFLDLITETAKIGWYKSHGWI